ncbi:MAG TPA: UDP-glucose 4-epimerase GalE [Caulobacteraceae bacterium]|nr:UDP-glucose 4-epimerase GalE [Caulobacteraceae bacterium]
MTVLVTGGAGYIGSHMAHALVDRGEQVVVIDNLVTGVRALVPEKAELVEGDVGDRALVEAIVRERGVDAVLHFAGSTVVPDSVRDPLAYYENNTSSSRSLLEACSRAGVEHFIFSSTAAVYAASADEPIDEGAATAPASPYGRSKLMTEWMLQDAAGATSMRYVILRYFNVAGADPSGRTGQSTPRATHLIKRACQAALGQIACLDIFGADWPTSDGTGVRDYIHVSDLVSAHLLALDHLRGGGASGVFNCGYGRGFSVRDVIAAVERASNAKLRTRERPRRPGDLAAVVADARSIRRKLHWRPHYDDLEVIVRHALDWERRTNAASFATAKTER